MNSVKHLSNTCTIYRMAGLGLIFIERFLIKESRYNTKLRSIDIERETPKFFKREQSRHFQNLRGPLSRPLIPSCDPLIATWYKEGRQ